MPRGCRAVVNVHVQPCGVDAEAGDGQSVMAATPGHGSFWPTVCHGLAECHTIHLARQVRVRGSVVGRKLGVRRAS
jgi:hypothetical protein